MAFLHIRGEAKNAFVVVFRQIIGLAKIAAFCKDQTLYETRQKDIREKSLEFWKIPDQVRKAPIMDRPQVKSGGRSFDLSSTN
jgi:hypothetical protein